MKKFSILLAAVLAAGLLAACQNPVTGLPADTDGIDGSRAATAAIYLKASWSGAAPTIWVWEGTGAGGVGNRPISQLAGYSWPGPAMAKDSVQDWWVWQVPAQFLPLNYGLKMKFAGGGAEIVLPGVVDGPRFWNGSAWSTTRPQAFPDRLGALYTPAATCFRIWSPQKTEVTVTVGATTYACRAVADFAGYTKVYEAVVPGDLKNRPYQFRMNGVKVRDPYALMVTPGTTEGVVVDMANIQPAGGWAPRPALAQREDAVIYEIHVRDFTVDSSSGIDAAKRGKFLGLTQTGTRYGTTTTGIDHLKELGVTHVQILPIYDFGTGMYNWGYDPVNYNVPEEQYAVSLDPAARIAELKTMINELHRNGIRVIMDVVYNHTYTRSVFEDISSDWYDPVNLSGCPEAGTLLDYNPMVSRMIRDSLEQWVENYGVDGFRFDLIGIFRTDSVKSWGEHLNARFPDRNLLIYGEPWNGNSTDQYHDSKVRLGKIPTLAGAHVGAFNSKYREAIKGGSDDTKMNYIFNRADMPNELWWGAIAAGMRGSLVAVKSTAALPNEWDCMFAYDPEQTINYIAAHDNLCLWDKIQYCGISGGAAGYAGRIDKFGTGMILASQGIPFIHGGDDFLRSKAYGGDYETAKNTYNASDNYNRINWADKQTNAAVFTYYRDAIALRKATPALRLTSWDDIKARMQTRLNSGGNNAAAINTVNDPSLPSGVVVSWISSNPAQPSAYDTVVVFNPGTSFSVSLPAGSWTKVFDINGAVRKTDTVCEGTAVTVFKKN